MPLSIVHVASEMVPFSKTGGLADVVGALPVAQARLGHTVRVVIPYHRVDLDGDLLGTDVGPVEAMGVRARLRHVDHRGVEVVLVDAPALFVRPSPYTLPDGDYPDNAVRFAFLARAALQAAAAAPCDVLHVHDWQAALVPVLLDADIRMRRSLDNPATVITVHNLSYQGAFPAWAMQACALPPWMFSVHHLEFYGRVSFLKGGLVTADAVTTVSPTYAEEILRPEFGVGLEGVLASRRDDLTGIVNGLDVELWDPSTDAYLPAPYDAAGVAAGKASARAVLAAEHGVASGRPLLAMVSRLAEQKGIDVVAASIDEIVAAGFDIFVLGSGERRWEELLTGAAEAHPGRVTVRLGFDERLAHLLYAASDAFLMPSRFEPCGLGQLIAMRYGSIPVVRRTGGLADTVRPFDSTSGTGVLFDDAEPRALLDAIHRLRELLSDARRLARTRRNGMTADFSWQASARRYVELYERLRAD